MLKTYQRPGLTVNTASRGRWHPAALGGPLALVLALLLGLVPAARGSVEPETVRLETRKGAYTSAVFYRPSQAFTEAVLILPGAGETPEDWRRVAESFHERNLAVLVPSLTVETGGSAPATTATPRYDEEDARFRGSPAAVRRTSVYARFLDGVTWLRDASEQSSAQTTARGGLDVLTVIAHREATTLLGPWIAHDPHAAQVLVLLNPWPEAGFDLAAPLEAFSGPLLSVWVDGDEANGRLAETMFLSRPRTRSLWRLELSGESNDLVRRPEFCEDLPQWSLKAMRKLGGKAFTDADP